MSRFSQAFQLGFDAIAHNNGERIGYVKGSADPVEITAIVGPVQVQETEEQQGSKRYATRTLRVGRDAIPLLQWADTFLIEEELWSIKEINGVSETAYTLTVMRATSRIVGRPGVTQRPTDPGMR